LVKRTHSLKQKRATWKTIGQYQAEEGEKDAKTEAVQKELESECHRVKKEHQILLGDLEATNEVWCLGS